VKIFVSLKQIFGEKKSQFNFDLFPHYQFSKLKFLEIKFSPKIKLIKTHRNFFSACRTEEKYFSEIFF